MARYFFDATSDRLSVTDFHGRDIRHRDELRPAILEAVCAIRTFLGDEQASGDWSLEVRLGDDNRIAAIGFDDLAPLEAETATENREALAA